MLKIKVFSLGLVMIFVGLTNLQAQNRAAGFGQIEGVVTDVTNGETLIGVNVLIEGTSLGTATNVSGEYIIRRVPAGNHVLIVSYIGYERVELNIEVSAGETLQNNIELRQETVEGEEVVISAQRQGQIQAMNQQIESDRIVNVVSEARIQELPDFNAAAAIGRLPGVSTQKSSGEDNKVVIRGLSPKYNSVEVEGIKLAATGSSQIGLSSAPNVGGTVSNDRSVDLTMVSPYMVRTISVYKSLTPDMNANSIGGTVNMELRSAPPDPHFDVMWQQGYTAKSNTYGNYRAIASGSNRFFNDKIGVYALINAESYDRNADNMGAGYLPVSTDVDPATGFRPVEVTSVSFNRHIETRNRFGGNLILDYSIPKGSIKLINMFTRLDSDFTDHRQVFNYRDGGIGWTLRTGENTIDQQLNSLKLNYDFGIIKADVSASFTSSNNVIDDSPLFTLNQTGGLGGGLAPQNEVPENLTFLVNYNGNENVALRTGNLFSSDYSEDKYVFKGDFEVPFNVGTKVSGFFKFGGQFDTQTITNDQETPYLSFGQGDGTGIQGQMMQAIESEFGISINPAGDLPGNYFVNNNKDLFDPFLNDRFGELFYASNADLLKDILNFVGNDPRFDASNSSVSTGSQGGWYDGPYQQLTNDYEYTEEYFATYAMSRINLKDLMIIGGVRYEKVDSEYFAYNARDQRNAQQQVMYDTTSYSQSDFVLPMGQMRYSPFEWMDVRYAYSQTLARPDYSQLSPKFTITQGTPGSVIAGNPELQPAKSINHDFNLTFHSNKIGLLSVGVFYKDIEDFVYTARYSLNDVVREAGIDSLSRYIIRRDGAEVVRPNDKANVIRYLNNPFDATVKGLEFELQTSFWYLPAPFRDMVFGLNYTRMTSETRYPIYEIRSRIVGRTVEEVLIDSSRAGRLLDQPNDILNSYLGYDYKGFSTRLSFLFQGNSVNSIGRYPESDGFTRDYFRIDFSARQKLPIAQSELFLDVQNLNNVNNESAQRTTGGFNSIQNYGLTANIGIRIRY